MDSKQQRAERLSGFCEKNASRLSLDASGPTRWQSRLPLVRLCRNLEALFIKSERTRINKQNQSILTRAACDLLCPVCSDCRNTFKKNIFLFSRCETLPPPSAFSPSLTSKGAAFFIFFSLFLHAQARLGHCNPPSVPLTLTPFREKKEP